MSSNRRDTGPRSGSARGGSGIPVIHGREDVNDILGRIDAALDNLCPCGADPRPGSPYCSYDCEPTHVAVHTDRGEACAMRWRPDLVTAVDDRDRARRLALRSGAEYLAAAIATMRPAFEQLNRAVADLSRGLSEVFRRPTQAAEPASTDPSVSGHPMLAAIEARRHRNTGPEQRLRAPRQINLRRR